MKKIIAILLLLAMCFTLYACEEKPNDSTTDNDTTIKDNTTDTSTDEPITLTTNNFKDYFAVQLDPQNIREYDGYPACDLVVKIDSLTYKKLSNVTVSLKIKVIEGDYYHPKNSVNPTKANDFTRTVTVPANGSTNFLIMLRADYYAAVGIPKISDFEIEILSVTGTLY